MFPDELAVHLLRGTVIPAHPLALDASRHLDERRQSALTRYYLDAGVGGLAVGVHTTQFEIHDAKVGLLAPVLELASCTATAALGRSPRPLAMIAGVIGRTAQAVREAEIARHYGYHAVLLSLAAFRQATDAEVLQHCRHVAEVMPLFGFYLQPAVGGRILSYSFWRQFVEIDNVVAIKIAPFDRYRTWDVVRAVIDAGRGRQIALYTGNDDSIVADLVTEYVPGVDATPMRITGGLLGHWAVWTRKAVEMVGTINAEFAAGKVRYRHWLGLGTQILDANAAFFDPAHTFRGSIAGLHEVLRRQGLLAGNWCLNPAETLSPGQAEAIDRVYRLYPHLNDDAFVAEHLDAWLHG
jgi:dihydrodipicolinate synthase/N-acetylneuraminate lyase